MRAVSLVVVQKLRYSAFDNLRLECLAFHYQQFAWVLPCRGERPWVSIRLMLFLGRLARNNVAAAPERTGARLGATMAEN